MATDPKQLDMADASSSRIRQVPVPEKRSYVYDVFISFRGVDTRDSFIAHLYHALTDAGINAFKDDEELCEGEEISFGLVRAIRGSRIHIVVFSTNYANSRWCLNELAEIVEWKKTSFILPVFYGVDSDFVLSQIRRFGLPVEAIESDQAELMSRMVMRWSKAYIKATALLKGLDLVCKDEAILVKHIVHWVELKLEGRRPFDMTLEIEGLNTTSLDAEPVLGQSAASFPPPASSTYDVFLCYRGVDTRGKFTSHLCRALSDAGINTLKDDESLLMGEKISLGLVRAIRSSRISVVVLSKSFANSTWCLEEVAEIIKWKQTIGQLVLPIFYCVDPSDVRRQKGSFAEAFVKHEDEFISERENVTRWRKALTEVGSLSGWVVGNFTNRMDEANTIKEIVRRISVVLTDQTYLHFASFPVGIDSYQPDINLLMSVRSSGVRFIGILGMGGIGKTTIAKVIYNKFIHQFEGKSFLENVRINSEQPNDVVHLQQQLLHDTLKFKRVEVKFTSIHQGISIIKERLHNKRVLIVLDDVNDLEQVRALAGDRGWFGSGSRIILTTRYQQLLETIKVDSIFKVRSLNDSESLQLLCSHAFGDSYPKQGFIELSKQVLRYSKGVPLALEVLGCSLHNKREEDWHSTLERLKTIPDYRIQAQLRVSFDALGQDDRVKELFLDIACFFVGWDKDYTMMILEACGLFAKKGIRDLTDKCLLEVDETNKLKMHDLIRDMGKEIVREKSTNDPGKRSRLWLGQDILSTLRSHLGTEVVEGIDLTLSESNKINVNAEAFATMKRLRLLKLNNVYIGGEYGLISKELRWLCWHNCSLKFIPNDLYMEQMVIIDMQHSHLREVWNDDKFLVNLKVLNLSHSHSLTKTPNFLTLPNLEELILEDCIELVHLHDSIGHLKRLVLANLRGCRKLKVIPDNICRVKSLRIFSISGCSKVDKLPEDFGQIESLTTLLADGTAITQVPSSIKHLKMLTDFSLSGCKVSNSMSTLSLISSFISTRIVPKGNKMLLRPLMGLSSLKTVKLMDCNLSDDEAVAGIFGLRSLENLDLRKNHFRFLPGTVKSLKKLKYLHLDNCTNLSELPDMPPSLLYLSAVKCTSLDRVSISKFGCETRLVFTNCHRLRMIAGLDRQEPEGSIHLEGCHNLDIEFREFLLKDWCGSGCGNVFLPGGEIPHWFDHRTSGSSLSLKMPPPQDCKLNGFTCCVIYSSNVDNKELQAFPSVYIEPLNISFSAMSYENIAVTLDDHMWVFYVPNPTTGGWSEYVGEVKLVVDFGVGWNAKWLGVHFQRDMVQQLCDSTECDPAAKRARAELDWGSTSNSNEDRRFRKAKRMSLKFSI